MPKLARRAKKSLMHRIFLVLLLTVLVPAIAVSVFLYRSLSSGLFSDTLKIRSYSIGQTATQVSNALASIRNECRYIVNNSVVRNLLSKGDLLRYPLFTQRYVEDSVALLRNTFEHRIKTYRNACIYSFVSSLPSGSIFYDEALLAQQSFYTEPGLVSGGMTLAVLNQAQTELYYQLKDGSAPKLSSLILIIHDIYNYVHHTSNGKLVLELTVGNLFNPEIDVASQCLLFEASDFHYGNLPQGMTADRLAAALKDGYVHMNRTYHPFVFNQDYGFFVVDSVGVPEQNYLRPAIGQATLVMMVFLIMVLVIILLFRRIFSRINENINAMDRIIDNRFAGKIQNVQEDEVGQIAQRYNIILDKIAAQAQELVQEENARKLAQYEALRHQLNPHFIYNTLNIFSGTAQEAGHTGLGDAIAYFGHLLRYNLQNTGNFTELEQELENAVRLVNIYALGETRKIRLEIDVQERLRRCTVMKYLLQPILENSIVHGMGTARSQMEIRVSAYQDDDSHFLLEVRDDGLGICEQRLVQIRGVLDGTLSAQDISSPAHLFIGLGNIEQRLRLFYDDQACLQIESSHGQYTLIRIRLPIILEDEMN